MPLITRVMHMHAHIKLRNFTEVAAARTVLT